MPDRPNFVLVFPDQWRGDCLGCMGHPVVETPFLDEIAHQGVVFESAYTACPSCIATRASLATGMTPNSAGRIGYKDGVPWQYEDTFMRTLRDAGYQTMQVGKTHFYPRRVNLGFERNVIYDIDRPGEGKISDYHDWLDEVTDGNIRDTHREVSSNMWVPTPWRHPEHLHPNVWTFQTAIELIQQRDPTRPFFLQVSPHRPHPPLDPPVSYYERYQERQILPPPIGDWAEKHAVRATATDCSVGKLPEDVIADSRRAYYAQITHLDYQIARLMRALPGGNTWFIFMSDHGEMHGDNNLWRKTAAYEGSAHVPLVVRPPGGTDQPRRCDEPIAHMDIMPTMLEAAGVDIPDTVEGESIIRLVEGDTGQWREYIHGEHAGWYHHQYVTDGKEKFVWDTVSGKEQFFDLTEDPYETQDLSNDPAHADRVKLWRDRLIDVLSQRPEDGLTDGKRLIPGTALDPVRPHLLED